MNEFNTYICEDGRVRVYLKDTKRVMSYPKFLMEQALGRKLLPNEQVHHKDENPLNNVMDNLEIKLLGKHQQEHSTKYYDKVAVCEWCDKEFLWTADKQSSFHRNHSRKNREYNNSNPFCSRSCAAKYGRFIQLSK